VLNTAINTAVKSLTGSGSLGGLIYDLTHDTDELAKAAPVGADGLKKIGDAASDAADPTKRLRD
jgi:hypothetical protein